MGNWLTEKAKTIEYDEAAQTKIDSLDRIFSIKLMADSLNMDPDSIAALPDSAIAEAANRVLLGSQDPGQYEQFGLEGTDIDYNIRVKEGFLPSGPERGFWRKYSDVGEGTDVMNLLGIPGVPTVGLGKKSILYDPTPEFGEEKYYREYTDELIRRAEVLDDPEGLMWKSRWVAGGQTDARFLGRPDKILSGGEEYIEKERVELYNNAILALDKMPSDSKAHKDLNNLLSRNEWKNYKYDENVMNSLFEATEETDIQSDDEKTPNVSYQLMGTGTERDPERWIAVFYNPDGSVESTGYVGAPGVNEGLKPLNKALDMISEFKADSAAGDAPIKVDDSIQAGDNQYYGESVESIGPSSSKQLHY